jgi:hypothetical protein
MTDAAEPAATAEPAQNETAPHLIEEMRGSCIAKTMEHALTVNPL